MEPYHATDVVRTFRGQKSGRDVPTVTTPPPPPQPDTLFAWWCSLRPTGLHDAWFPHELPRRSPDSYMITCDCHRCRSALRQARRLQQAVAAAPEPRRRRRPAKGKGGGR